MIKIIFLILISLPHTISVSAQNTIEIDKFDGPKLKFNRIKNRYHIVEASSDLNNWLIVGHYTENGEIIIPAKKEFTRSVSQRRVG